MNIKKILVKLFVGEQGAMLVLPCISGTREVETL